MRFTLLWEQHDNPELKGKPIAVGGEHLVAAQVTKPENLAFVLCRAKLPKKMSASYFCKAKISSLQRNFRKSEKFFMNILIW